MIIVHDKILNALTVVMGKGPLDVHSLNFVHDEGDSKSFRFIQFRPARIEKSDRYWANKIESCMF